MLFNEKSLFMPLLCYSFNVPSSHDDTAATAASTLVSFRSSHCSSSWFSFVVFRKVWAIQLLCNVKSSRVDASCHRVQQLLLVLLTPVLWLFCSLRWLRCDVHQTFHTPVTERHPTHNIKTALSGPNLPKQFIVRNTPLCKPRTFTARRFKH